MGKRAGAKEPHSNARRRRRRTLAAAEFFSGIGLVRLALEQERWRVVYANDIDTSKAEMYRHNWPKDDHLVVEDIHRLDSSDVPECDLFTASFPCNDLSIAGKWKGLGGKESSAYWGFIRIVREMRGPCRLATELGTRNTIRVRSIRELDHGCRSRLAGIHAFRQPLIHTTTSSAPIPRNR